MTRAWPLVLMALILGGCFARGPRVPEGVVVAPDPTPPPPPEAVAQAQRKLRSLALYVGAIDGVLSPSTGVALARYQRSNELPVTGVLDEATALALGLEPLESYPTAAGGQGEGAGVAPRPSAEEILEAQQPRPLPQPPPGALDEARARAAAILTTGIEAAAERLGAARGLLPGDPSAAMGVTGAAWQTLAASRQEAFLTMLEARRQGGWALLPQVLIRELETELQRRALLLRGVDGDMGSDDADAIRWVERSLGLPITGRPGLQLLEALGIDASPMFAQ